MRRQWRVIAAGVALGGLLATGYLNVTPATTTATADVNITVISTDPFSSSRQASSILDDATEIQIARSYPVADAAARSIGEGTTAAEVRQATSVRASDGASVVYVSYTAATAAEATTGADQVALAYLAYRSSQADLKRNAILAGVANARNDLRDQLIAASQRSEEAAAGSAESSQAASDRDLITIELNNLLGQKSNLEQVDTSGGSVLTEAAQNPVVTAPQNLRVIATGLLAGGVLGLIAAFPFNFFDRRMRNGREVGRATQAPVLAEITARLASIPEHGATAELLRAARERMLSAIPGTVRVIAVIDDTSGLQPSDVPVNLALSFAQGGHPVELLLPETTLQLQGFLRSRLGLTESTRKEPAKGAANTAGANRGEPSPMLRSTHTPALSVVFPADSRGGAGPDPQLALSVRDRLAAAQPGTLHFLVLRSTAPRSSLLAAGRLCDAAVVVAAAGHSTVDRVNEIVAESTQFDKLFLGTILVPEKRSIVLTPDPPARFQPVSIDVPIMRASLVE
jgi:capsular polysaccharide biosynthesis protein